MIPTTKDAYLLLHEGSIALSQVEHAGIRIDTEYLDSAISGLDEEIKNLQNKMRDDKVYGIWKQRFGAASKLGSREQLGVILYDHLGYKSKNQTASGRPKTDEEALSKIKHPFVDSFLKVEKLKKARTTYLEGIRREVVDGFLHPNFNLHTVETFRSSSSNPNFQNMPIRDESVGKLIRTAFIPRPNHRLVEIDYSGIEVRIAACYNHDPVLIEYINNPVKDMHRDMAAQIYLLKPNEVSKQVRYAAKNQFVFPQFYGSYYIDCAKALWEMIDKLRLKGPEDVPLKDHLKKHGITTRGKCISSQDPADGTFERHVKDVEQDFWGRRFKVYSKWKERWYTDYKRTTSFDSLTGFHFSGDYKRNEVINYPVQGSAFHCLLWSLIRLWKWLDRNGMKCKIVGQIHDSLLLDCPEDELQVVLSKATEIMTKHLPKKWTWIRVPLEVEVEVASTNWFEKKPWSEKNGVWSENQKA